MEKYCKGYPPLQMHAIHSINMLTQIQMLISTWKQTNLQNFINNRNEQNM